MNTESNGSLTEQRAGSRVWVVAGQGSVIPSSQNVRSIFINYGAVPATAQTLRHCS